MSKNSSGSNGVAAALAILLGGGVFVVGTILGWW